ncbi:ATP-binding protein [Beutenbergia cavernae]|nr:adenylate/guanylate cyclase domain-containing protein [Beutenbergia cavernae]
MAGQVPGADDVAQLRRAMEALEAQRDTLGDQVVDVALGPLRERLDALSARTAGEQRRLVTVVFADLVDFTTLSGSLDAEDVRGIVAAYFGRWQSAITRHGGVVEKFIGDAVMAVFGLYASEEDDAQRAVRAALEMRASLRDLTAAAGLPQGVRLHMRVGIDTGDVVVSTLGERAGHEFVAVGQTVNRASRIQAAAPVDGVLISAGTHRHVRGLFSFEERPGLVLKGIEDPVDAYLVRNERPARFHIESDGSADTPTVGRERELAMLRETLDDVVEERAWRLVTIVGDAGVGKSRLAFELDRWLSERPEPAWWFRGRATRSDLHRPNALLRTVLFARIGVTETDPPATVEQAIGTAFATPFGSRAAAAARTVSTWLGLRDPEPGTDPRGLRQQATTLLAELMARISEVAPVVVLLEDVHWADDESLDWLESADEQLRSARVYVVATARPALFDRRPLWGEGRAHHVRLDLAPLGRRASRTLLDELTHHAGTLPDVVVDTVLGAADGNPFYLEELAAWLHETGVVVRRDAEWRVDLSRWEPLVVPATLRGVLQARIDALGPLDRDVAQRAAVVGRVFWDTAVAAVAGEDPADVGTVLDRLRAVGIVQERATSSFDGTREFLFAHSLLRDVAYDGVLRSRRTVDHRQAAAWLADLTERTGRGDEYAAVVADHLERGADEGAAGWYLRAARRAGSVWALQDAENLLAGALRTAPADPALRFDAHAERLLVRERRGDVDGQHADLEAMAASAADLPADEARQLRLALARSVWAFERSSYDDASAHAAQAADLARHLGADAELAAAQLAFAKARQWAFDLDGARAALTDALRTARAHGLTDVEAEALRYRSMTEVAEDDYAAALASVEAAYALNSQRGDEEAQAVTLHQSSNVLYHLGRYSEALSALIQALPLFRRTGYRYREAVTLTNAAAIALFTGQLADAGRWVTESLEIIRRLDDQEALATALGVHGQVEALLGRTASAHELFTEALTIAKEVGDHQLEVDLAALLALLMVEAGVPESAREWAGVALASMSDAHTAKDRAEALLRVHYVYRELGEVSRASALARDLAAVVADVPDDVRARASYELELAAAQIALGRSSDHVELLSRLDLEALRGCVRPEAVLATALDAGDGAALPDVAELALALLDDRTSAIGDPDLAREYLATSGREALRQRASRARAERS